MEGEERVEVKAEAAEEEEGDLELREAAEEEEEDQVKQEEEEEDKKPLQRLLLKREEDKGENVKIKGFSWKKTLRHFRIFLQIREKRVAHQGRGISWTMMMTLSLPSPSGA